MKPVIDLVFVPQLSKLPIIDLKQYLCLVSYSGFLSPRKVFVSLQKFNPICPFFIVAFGRNRGMLESIFSLILTLSLIILEGMTVAFDETNCFASVNLNGFLLPS